MTRQALHAYRLTFIHPVTQQAMVLESEAPDDFNLALNHWGLSYNQGR